MSDRQCCEDAPGCPGCGEPLCCARPALICEVEGLVCADCHEQCVSVVCARENVSL